MIDDKIRGWKMIDLDKVHGLNRTVREDPARSFFVPDKATPRLVAMEIADGAGLDRTTDVYWRTVDRIEFAVAEFSGRQIDECLREGA